MLAIDVDPKVHLRRLPIGLYGQFLCNSCEVRSSHYDQLGVDFLRRPVADHEVVTLEAGSRVIVRHDLDADVLKLFALWCLWRAAASGRREFADLELGPFEARLARQLLADDPGSIDDFSVLVTLYGDDPRRMLSPWVLSRTNLGRRAYRTYLHGHTIAVKVDSMPFTDAMRYFVLNPKNPIVMPILSLVDSPLGDQMRRFMLLRGRLPPPRRASTTA